MHLSLVIYMLIQEQKRDQASSCNLNKIAHGAHYRRGDSDNIKCWQGICDRASHCHQCFDPRDCCFLSSTAVSFYAKLPTC